jgi:hypothetical protein
MGNPLNTPAPCWSGYLPLAAPPLHKISLLTDHAPSSPYIHPRFTLKRLSFFSCSTIVKRFLDCIVYFTMFDHVATRSGLERAPKAFCVAHDGLLVFLSASGGWLRSALSIGLGIISYEAALASASESGALENDRVARGSFDCQFSQEIRMFGVVYGLSNQYDCPHLRAEKFFLCDSACQHPRLTRHRS